MTATKYNDLYKDTRSKRTEEVERTAYIVSEMECCDASLKERHVLAFVVSHSRGRAAYRKVLAQTIAGSRRDTSWGTAVREFYSR